MGKQEREARKEDRKKNREKNATFRSAVGEAATEAKLSFGSRLKLGVIMSIPAYRSKLEEEMLKQAVSLNAVPNITALDDSLPMSIDWETLKSFIIEWLPTIIKLISVFFFL